MSRKGRLLGVAFAVFALICLVATYDYSKGRIPQTRSALVSDVLAVTNGRECARDATEIVTRYIPIGAGRADAERVLSEVTIDPPKPWFWTPPSRTAPFRKGRRSKRCTPSRRPPSAPICCASISVSRMAR